MGTQQLQAETQLILKQRIRMMVNQYEVRTVNPDGSEGGILAFAQQKRLALKEQVTLYTDDKKTEPILGFKARQAIDLAATYDVTDANGTTIGNFRKDFAKSLLRSTWHLEQPGYGLVTGQERNQAIAILRRFVLSMLPYHFDFAIAGRTVFSVQKKFSFGRDKYTIDIQDPNFDRRLVVAMAVALDALQAR